MTKTGRFNTKGFIAAFIFSFVLILVISGFSISYGRRVIHTLETGEKHFKEITSAATQISSFIKRAEGHLMLYLALHREIDRQKLPQRLTSLNKEIATIDRLVKDGKARAMTEEIKALNSRIPSIIEPLLTAHETEFQTTGKFDIVNQQQAVLVLHDVFSRLRELGVEVAERELELESEVKHQVVLTADKLRIFLYIATVGIIGFAFFLGIVLIRVNLSLNREILYRKQAQTGQQAEERKYKTLFENMTLGVFYQRADGVLSDANEAALGIFGLSHDQFVGKILKAPFLKIIQEDGSEFPGELHPSMEALKTGKIIKDVIAGVWNHQQNAFTWISITAIPQFMPEDNRPWQVFVTMLDITKLKTAEMALKKSEKELQLMSGQTEQLSLAAAEMISLGHKELVFQKISNAIVAHSDYKRVMISLFREEPPFRNIVGYTGFEKSQVDHLRSVEFSKHWFDNVFEQGRRIGNFSYYIPHTERQMLNKEAILLGQGSVQDTDNAWHPEGSLFVRMNDEKGEFIGMISLDDSKSGVIPKDKTIRPLEIFSSLISQIIILKREQEKRKLIEAQLQQAIKMESIGTLAGGIAHDFNNILGIILGNTELALEEIQKSHPVYISLEEIKMASLRAAEIVRQLLNFSRKSEYQFKSIKIVPVINETLDFLRSSIPTSIDIRRTILDPDVVVLADPVQIKQIIMNLCINSYQAMTDAKGCIDVIVEKVNIRPQDAISGSGLNPGSYVKITVADTGSGIAPEIRDRIFDPYFTTKEVGKGSGLGLAVVLGILKTHNGAILVDNKPDSGSRLFIFLPAADTIPEREISPEPVALSPGRESLLFVDDDAAITEMFNKILQRIGYQVKIFNDPVLALSVFQSDPDFFDLVITDMTMPKMSGAELARELMLIRPDIPVMICTGHSDFIDAQKAREIGIAAYVTKPIVIKEISTAIRNVLDRIPN